MDQEGKRSQASQLVDLARGRYRLGLSDDREPFAVDQCGPNIALMLGDGGLRTALAAAYFLEHEDVPSSSATADACRVLAGLAMQCPREPVALRVATHGAGLVVDLGDAEGRAVLISPGSWEVVDRSPVLFRRSKLTSAMPVPTRGRPIDDVFRLVNVATESRPLVLAVLVASLFPDIPHPIVLLTGEHGTGKSTAARFLFRLVDRSPAELRTAPREVSDWVVAASGSWVVTLDNISKIPPALSDALCKASTGDGMVRRQLHSDSGLSVVAFRRVVVLTSIDAGSLRGDLADRLVAIDLERISAEDRRDERDLEDAFSVVYRELLGALFALAAEVLSIRDSVRMTRTPRMADFARIVSALDQVRATRAFETRWGGIDEWGVRQLARHVRNLGKDPDPQIRLVYAGSGSGESRQASSCLAIGETLRRAGLGAEPDVRPLSVVAWAGARVFAETGRIEVAALALGVRSLDRAARLIGFDWHNAGSSS